MWSDCSICTDQQMAALCRLTSSNIEGAAVVRHCHPYANTGACISSDCLWMDEWEALNGPFHTVWLNPNYMQWLCNTAATGELCVSHQCRFHSTEHKHQPQKAALLWGIYVDAQTGSLESKCRGERWCTKIFHSPTGTTFILTQTFGNTYFEKRNFRTAASSCFS